MRLPHTCILHQRRVWLRLVSRNSQRQASAAQARTRDTPVAVTLGYVVAGEPLTTRLLLASVLVIASVILILTERHAAPK
jgi:hypothetical protein